MIRDYTLKLDLQPIKEYVISEKKSTDLTARKSNVGGWQSDSFFVDFNKNSLHDVLLSVITNIPNIKRGTKTSSTAWININPSGAFNSKHNHPNSDFSGVLWIKCPKDSGNIIFEFKR